MVPADGSGSGARTHGAGAERAVTDDGANPSRTAKKAREHLRAILYWFGNRS